MNKIIILILVTALSASAQTLTKKWATDTLVKCPESALWDTKNKVLYTANIEGKSDGKDGIGSIGKVSADGKILNAAWVTGLDAPKGMGLVKNSLYVADIDQVVVVDIATGKVTARIPIEGAKFLNDITVDPMGSVFVSDTGTNKIWKITANKPELFFESPEFKGINGLLSTAAGLYIVDFSSGSTFVLGADKNLQKTGETSNGADGIVSVGKNEFIISSWYGELYFVNADGKATKLIDTKAEKINSADVWFDAGSSTLYVPTFFANNIIAYTFKR